MADDISEYMNQAGRSGDEGIHLAWATAKAACTSQGITIDEMLEMVLSDGPWPSPEAESVGLVFGPPILHQLNLILKFYEQSDREVERT